MLPQLSDEPVSIAECQSLTGKDLLRQQHATKLAGAVGAGMQLQPGLGLGQPGDEDASGELLGARQADGKGSSPDNDAADNYMTVAGQNVDGSGNDSSSGSDDGGWW